jgi:hypothetical protein
MLLNKEVEARRLNWQMHIECRHFSLHSFFDIAGDSLDLSSSKSRIAGLWRSRRFL